MNDFRARMLAAARQVLEAQTDDIIELIEIAGLEPSTAFRGGDWNGCDFRGKDLRGFDFRGARLVRAKFQGARVHGALWDRAQGLNLSGAIQEDQPGPIAVDIGPFLNRIKSAKTYRAALYAYEELRKLGGQPTLAVFNALMARTQTYGQGDYVLRLMPGRNVDPDVETFTTLLSRAPDVNIANNLGNYIEKNFGLNTVSMNSWLETIDDLSAAKELIEHAKSSGVNEDARTLTILMSKMPDFRSRWKLLLSMMRIGPVPYDVTFKTVLHYANRREDALVVAQEMFQRNIRIDATDCNILLINSQTVQDALETLQAIGRLRERKFGLRWQGIDMECDPKVGFLAAMRGFGHEPDIKTFNAFLGFADGLDAALQTLRQMVEAGAVPDAVTLHHLSKWDSANVAISRAEDHLRLPLAVTSHIALIVIAACHDAEEATDWVVRLYRRSKYTYQEPLAALAKRIVSWSQALDTTRQLQDAGIIPGPKYYAVIYGTVARAVDAETLLAWHLGQANAARSVLGSMELALDAVMNAFLVAGKPQDALRIAVGWSHLPNAVAAIRDHPDLARQVFESFYATEPVNAACALAILAESLGDLMGALNWFADARARLDGNPKRQAHIHEQIDRLRAALRN